MMGELPVLVGLVAVLLFGLLVALLVITLVLSRRPTSPTLDPSLQGVLAQLQESARAQGQQVNEVMRSLQDLAHLTTQLQTRLQTTEQHQLTLQHGFQRLSEGLGSLQSQLTMLPDLQKAATVQGEQVTQLTRALRELTTFTAQLQTRLESGERRHEQLHESVQHMVEVLGELRSGLTGLQQQHGTTTTRLDQLQQALTTTQQVLAELRRNDEESRRQQDELARFVSRIDAVLTGSASRGAAGEHILEAVLEHLPAEFKAFNLPIRNRTVEFAFRLPNGKHVPVDSKWVGIRQLEQLEGAGDEHTRQELEQALARRIEEVAAYLDPDLTLGLAIVAVPDAVYRWTQRLHCRALERGVIVIAYSMAVPYFLTLLHFALRFLRDEQTARLSTITHQLEQALDAIQQELHGRYARGLTMLQNSRDALAQQAASALVTLRQLQALDATTGVPALAETVENGERAAQ
ncbi:MAG: DNA recombination protein RmuC [Thermomicrobium sp.]|nr:DNA recombination protein RmuC [Thermomicrobium sp.]